jgi:hypothetical protein
MRLASFLVLCGLLGGPAGAAPTRKPPPPPLRGSVAETIASLPADLAGWRRGATTDFAQGPGGPALGQAVEYRPPGGPGVVTVYAYDRGLPLQRDGLAAPALAAEEMATARSELVALGPYRGYQVLGFGDGPVLAGAAGQPALRCDTALLAFVSGPQAEAFICLGVHRGRFLKLRLTLPAWKPDLNERVLRGFVAALLEAAR